MSVPPIRRDPTNAPQQEIIPTKKKPLVLYIVGGGVVLLIILGMIVDSFSPTPLEKVDAHWDEGGEVQKAEAIEAYIQLIEKDRLDENDKPRVYQRCIVYCFDNEKKLKAAELYTKAIAQKVGLNLDRKGMIKSLLAISKKNENRSNTKISNMEPDDFLKFEKIVKQIEDFDARFHNAYLLKKKHENDSNLKKKIDVWKAYRKIWVEENPRITKEIESVRDKRYRDLLNSILMPHAFMYLATSMKENHEEYKKQREKYNLNLLKVKRFLREPVDKKESKPPQSNEVQKKINDYLAIIKIAIDNDMQRLSSIKKVKAKVMNNSWHASIVVDDDWHKSPYVQRFKDTQFLQRAWAGNTLPATPDLAWIAIFDTDGRRVGRSNGKSTWVQD